MITAFSPPRIAADPRFIRAIPHDFARRHLVLGVVMPGEFAAPEEPADPRAPACVWHGAGVHPAILGNLAVALGLAVAPIEHDAEQLAKAIDDAYLTRSEDGDGTLTLSLDPSAGLHDLDDVLAARASGADTDLLSIDEKGPVVRLVDASLLDAIARGASDIHVQPLAHATLIRFRIDGVLMTVRTVPASLSAAIVSRIKVMARLDVAERRSPQDGRATVRVGRAGESPAIDLRISTLPATFGERAVIRLLDVRSAVRRAEMDALMMPPDVLERYVERTQRSSGIVLVTGPTGSGKTTTLYATLRHLISRSSTGRAKADINVLTIEDPVEYDLSAAHEGPTALPISQTQIDPRRGLTFASGLRHILRQDPDVIMVGEIRDSETARTAVQASLTGHLVLSTLHTNSACGAVVRLLDLGVEPFLVADSLSAVLAQRLVRLTHAPCAGTGCADCLHSGFRGRRGIFELLVVTDEVRAAIADRSPQPVLMDAARSAGLRSLEEEGAQLVPAGLTTQVEVSRVTKGAL